MHCAILSGKFGSGLLSLFKRTIPLRDPMTTTIRGSSIGELSFGAILLHAEQAAGTLLVAPGEVIDGVTTEALTLATTGSGADNVYFSKLKLESLESLPVGR